MRPTSAILATPSRVSSTLGDLHPQASQRLRWKLQGGHQHDHGAADRMSVIVLLHSAGQTCQHVIPNASMRKML